MLAIIIGSKNYAHYEMTGSAGYVFGIFFCRDTD
jgi:hypothetical protein